MNSFLKDVANGLTASPKFLLSKYFYDDEGSRIFQQIMEMPEYYLTNCELEILTHQSSAINKAINFSRPFHLIELGAGDGVKTKALLKYLTGANVDFSYVPVDISEEAMNQLKIKMQQAIPELKMAGIVGDYFNVLNGRDADPTPKLLLFLGSNIGNYHKNDAIELLRLFNSFMNTGDKLLVGFDLKKNPRTILDAYSDQAGITRSFNLNLLKRINRELGGTFDLDFFDFYSYYNPETGDVKSFLVSLKKQVVAIQKSGQVFDFEKDELIYTELSKKYSLQEIKNLGASAGFDLAEHFIDSKGYFSDSLFVKNN